MTDDILQQGVKLQVEIAQVSRVIERLRDPGFFIELHQSNNLSRGMALIATVGVGESCEHDLARFATDFYAKVLDWYEELLLEKQKEYASL